MARKRTTGPPTEADARNAAAMLDLVADATRLGIMLALAEGDASCTDLLPVAQGGRSSLTGHLNRLSLGGLVERRREGRLAIYSLTPAGRALAEAVRRLVD